MRQWDTGDTNVALRYECGTGDTNGTIGARSVQMEQWGTNDCMNGCTHAPQHACTASMRCMHECSACMNELHAWMWFMHDIYGVVLMHFITLYCWCNHANWCCNFCAFIYFLFDAAVVHSISFCQCHRVHASA